MYLLFISPLWVITCINLLPDNLRLCFLYFFLLFFALKLPISNFKRWSLLLVFYSVLIQFKENYLLCFQDCGFSIQKKCKSHFLFSRYSKSCGEGKAKQKMCLSERIWLLLKWITWLRGATESHVCQDLVKNHSLFTKERVLILIVCWHVLASLTQWTTQVSFSSSVLLVLGWPGPHTETGSESKMLPRLTICLGIPVWHRRSPEWSWMLSKVSSWGNVRRESRAVTNLHSYCLWKPWQ